MSENKPVFVLNESIVFKNLHILAVDSAASACHVSDPYKDIINSAMSIKQSKFITKDVKTAEIAIVKKFEDFKDLTSMQTEKFIAKLRQQIFAGIVAYVAEFAGKTVADKLKIDDLVQFIPDQNTGEVEVKDFKFV